MPRPELIIKHLERELEQERCRRYAAIINRIAASKRR